VAKHWETLATEIKYLPRELVLEAEHVHHALVQIKRLNKAKKMAFRKKNFLEVKLQQISNQLDQDEVDEFNRKRNITRQNFFSSEFSGKNRVNRFL